MKLTALTIKHHPKINRGWAGDSILNFKSVNIGLAVAREDGLITPVIKNCEEKGIIEIQNELNDLIPRAREGKLSKEEYSNAGFTISNLGMYDIDEFTAIINPPGCCILAIGKIAEQPVVKEDSVSIANTIKMTLSCDHRVVDGVVGAKFLSDLKRTIECPLWAMI